MANTISPATQYAIQWRKEKKEELKKILIHLVLEEDWATYHYVKMLTKRACGIELNEQEEKELKGK